MLKLLKRKRRRAKVNRILINWLPLFDALFIIVLFLDTTDESETPATEKKKKKKKKEKDTDSSAAA